MDRHLLHPKIVADQWRECSHRAAFDTGENGCESCRLLVIRPLVDLTRDRPIALGHRAWSVGDEGDVEAS
jgi:hypothetical protein